MLAIAALLLAGCACESGIDITGDVGADVDSISDTVIETHDSGDATDVPEDASPSDSSSDAYPEFYDSFYDMSWDVDAMEGDPAELPPIAIPPSCGDGVLDSGEECDDRNRLNGDGCDWTCHAGDGDALPPPEDLPPYEPSGPPVHLPGFEGSTTWAFDRLPLVWTGSEYATAVFIRDGDTDLWSTRMRRFLPDATPLGPDWVFNVKATEPGGDLAWTGSEYGLFFVDGFAGIEHLRISPDGEPIGFPHAVVHDYRARFPAVAVTDSGFALAWMVYQRGWGTGVCSDTSSTPETDDAIEMCLLGFDGSIVGGPVLVEPDAGGPPDVAAGAGGYAVTAMVGKTEEWPSCSFRLVRLSEDLSRATYSGILGNGEAGDVGWTDGRYVTAWPHYDTMYGGPRQQCVARFLPDGSLEGPPACNEYVIEPDPGGGPGPTCLAPGDSGLMLVFSENSNKTLLFLRTGLNGVAVGVPRSVGGMCYPGAMPGCYIGPYNAVWADDGFGVLSLIDNLGSDYDGLFMWTLRAGEGGG